ncbi:hypothetical protein ACWFRJ_04070 [Streptomyces sp. NPDC055239]
MSYFMYNVLGETVDEPDPETMRHVLDGLTNADDEHPDLVAREETLRLFGLLAAGDVVPIEALSWQR